jgi:colanic acid/amylovoran biosynthesis glycosyltransferase
VANLHAYLDEGEGDFDAFHAHFGPTGDWWDFLTTSRLLDAEPDQPFVVSFYGHDASRMLREDPDRYHRLFERADTVTVLSEDMKGILEEAGCPPGKLRIQPLSVDTDFFDYQPRPDPGDGPVEVVTVARLVEKKGFRYALEALAEVGEDVDVRYRVAGDGPLREDLERRARELGVDDVVTFLGWQQQEEVRDLLEEAHVFLLPSVTSEDGDQEGTPTVLLEAQAQGVPVVTTRHAGIPEVVDEDGSALLVPPRDVGALAEALWEVVTSPDRWDEMGKRGRRYVEERHSIPAAARRLEDIYGVR